MSNLIFDEATHTYTLYVETATQKNRYGETVRFARYRRKENGTEII